MDPAEIEQEYQTEAAIERWRERRDRVTEALSDRGEAHYEREQAMRCATS
jgi:hypothetical protein